jgi:hypothetical protein
MRSLVLAVPALFAACAAFAQDPTATPPQDGGHDMMTLMDTDRDGAVSREEFVKGHVRADDYFARLDANKDGAVSREEFLAEPPGPKRSERFKQLDTNGDGRITREEVDARRTARFDMLDSNRDGKLTADEIEAAHAAMKRRKPGAGPEAQ